MRNMEARANGDSEVETATREEGMEMVGWNAETVEDTAKSDNTIDEWNFIILRKIYLRG
jgi:hypothetical protein